MMSQRVTHAMRESKEGAGNRQDGGWVTLSRESGSRACQPQRLGKAWEGGVSHVHIWGRTSTRE